MEVIHLKHVIGLHKNCMLVDGFTSVIGECLSKAVEEGFYKMWLSKEDTMPVHSVKVYLDKTNEGVKVTVTVPYITDQRKEYGDRYDLKFFGALKVAKDAVPFHVEEALKNYAT